MELSWIGYVNWARKEVKKILSCITCGTYSQGERYALLKIVLYGIINMECVQKEGGIQISIILNHLDSADNGIYIKTNCSCPPITTRQLQKLVADQQSLFVFLSNLSKPNGIPNSIPYLTIVNNLSSFLCVSSKKDGLCSYLRYQNGIDDFILDYTSDENGIDFRIVPDEDVFGDSAFNFANVASIAKQCVEESHIMITLQDGANFMVFNASGDDSGI